jgi:hypothetical protein
MPETEKISVTVSKTVQEKDYEPFRVEVTALVSVEDLKTPEEVDATYLSVAEALQDNMDDILESREKALG